MPDLALVKRNVGKMVDQSAPESDIDAYIASEGASADEIRSFKPTQDNSVAYQSSLGKQTGTGSQLLTGFQNTLTGAEQGTNPSADPKNFISNQVSEDDAGNAWFKDAQGNSVQADSAKHVILRDPADNVLKAYARTSDTNESGIVGGARVLAQGLGATSEFPAVVGAASAAKAIPALTEGQKVAQAGDRLGIQIPRAVTSDNPSTQQFAQSLSGIPVVGTPLKEAAQKTIQQTSNALSETRAAYGTGDVASAGQGVREGIAENLKDGPIKRAVNEAYEGVNKMVDPDVTSLLPNIKNLTKIIQDKRTNAGLSDSAVIGDLDKAIAKTNPARGEGGQFQKPTGMNYQGVKDLRTHFGDMLDGAKPIPEGMDYAEVKQAYGALTQDLKSTVARAGGQSALNAFNRAEAQARQWSGIRKSLSTVLKIQNEEGIFSKIVSLAGTRSTADINLLNRVRQAVGPQKWDEVASSVLERLGRAPDGSFSPDRLIGPSGLGGMSREGKDLLFRSTGKASHADAIDDIALVSKRMSQINKLGNPSGTAKNSLPYVVAGAIGASARAVFAGDLITPAAMVGSLVGGRIFANILAKPLTARAMASWSRAYESALTKPNKATIQSFRAASGLFASSVGRTFGRPDLVGNIAQQLQGSVPAAAQDEQK